MQWRRQGVWAYRRIGVSAYRRMGVWAYGRGNPGMVGRKTRRAQDLVPLRRQSAAVLSRGVGVAQEDQTAFKS